MKHRIFSEFKEDAIRIRSNGTRFHHRAIIDTQHTDVAHRDLIQLIPRSRERLQNLQYAGASLRDITIQSNVFFSQGKAQCVFGSDGFFNGINVLDNLMQTRGSHFISINGLEFGVFKNNLDQFGEPVPIQLDNLRIGGGLNGGVWVLSMRDYEYKSIKADNLNDFRGRKNPTRVRTGARYIKHLELDLFRYESRKIKAVNGNDFAKQAQALALRMGEIVK